MQDWIQRYRKVVYVLLYEFFAILFGAIIMMLFPHRQDQMSTLTVSAIVSVIAVCWNYLFNTGFEWAEDRFRFRRNIFVRLVHATGFEGTLMLVCVPLYMYWFDLSFWGAFQMEASLLLFFFCYTYVFTWIFDYFFPRKVTKVA